MSRNLVSDLSAYIVYSIRNTLALQFYTQEKKTQDNENSIYSTVYMFIKGGV